MGGAGGTPRPPFLYRLGALVARRRFPVLVGYLLIVVAIAALSRAAGGEFVNNFAVPGSGSQAAQNLINEHFPTKRGVTAQVVFEAKSGNVRAHRAEIESALERAASLPHVYAVGDPFAEPSLDDALTSASAQVSGDRAAAYAVVQYSLPSARLSYADLERLQRAVAPVRSAQLDVAVGGTLPLGVSPEPDELPELIGLLAAVVILLIVLGSVVAAGLPLVHAGVGLLTSLSLIALGAGLFSVSSTATSLATMVGLGVGVDYGLLSVSRFREELRGGRPMTEAVAVVVSTAGKSIAFAGLTVVVAIAGLAVAGIPAIQVMGAAAAMTVAILAGGSVIFLPSLLAIAAGAVNRFSVRRRRADATRERSLAAALTRLALRRPAVTIVVGVAFLGALSFPVLSMRLSMPSGKTAQPGSEQLRAYDHLREHFAPGANGPLSIAMLLERPATPDHSALKDLNLLAGLAADASKRAGVPVSSDTKQGLSQEREYFKSPASDPRLVKLQRRIQKLHGVVSVSPGIAAEDPRAVLMAVTPISGPASEQTQQLTDRLRRKVLPHALGKDDQGYVGGSTALSLDFASTSGERMPLLIGTVVLLAALLLTIAFRSVLVPLKAALLTLLPVGAGMGVLVIVFQWGIGADLLGVHATTPVFAYVPMLLFAIVFGLSIDYEVFLMSRVREEQVKGGDAREAVARGIGAIGRVVAAAASIMTAVFVAFFFEPDLNIKMLALGLATAIVCEAVVISFAVSPAVMALLGPRAWALPGWLDRILPHVSVEGESVESGAPRT